MSMTTTQLALALDGPAYKRCSMCGAVRPIADFAYRSIARGTRSDHCRECHAKARRRHYEANRETYNAHVAAQMARRRTENRALIHRYLLGHPCADCGETDPIVLEFDHRDPTDKVDAIAMLLRCPPARVRAEIAKCDVRCVNCHRRRTADQFGWRGRFEVSA